MKKSSDDLLKEMNSNKMKTIKDYEEYRKKNAESFKNSYMKLDRALMSLIESKKLTRATVIKRAGVSQSYGYQILDGRKSNPDRDKVIMMCIGIGTSIEETQNLLKVTGYPILRASNERDHFLIFAIVNHISIIDINLELQKLELKILE